MIPRQIVGPQDQFERTGAQSLRDIRPFSVRLVEALQSSASGMVLGMAAVGTYFEPAIVNIALPASLAYAAWVLTRKVKLPMRAPMSSGLLDYSNPTPGSRKAKRATGSQMIGWNLEGHELWLAPEDARQHISIPGTTGAGKTTTILSLLVNALAQGSGFVLVDGKADRTLFGSVMGLARRFGREDDVRLLNLMVASGFKISNTFNAFAIGNADAVREVLASQLGEQASSDSNGIFRERAVALIASISPALVWLRDHRDVPLTIDFIRSSIELIWIWKLAMQKTFRQRDYHTGEEVEVDVKEIPEDVIWPLKSYLGELPGYDASVPLDKQKGEEPSKQHGFAQFYFTPIFTQLTVSLGHIFRVDCGDIDMRDIVLNRRILVVNLPALENSDATLAALGKLVVASLRGMMAQLLGASPEGDYDETDRPGMGPSPYTVVLDELAYYATAGLDRMLSQGRGLNISFMLGFQEVSGIWARLGEKTASLLGNTNTTIAMRQQDSGRTREWLEKTAGQTNVTQAVSYQGGADGAYREARHAEVRTVSRVDWNDLTSLIEGEAIVLFGGRRIYARVFHAKIDGAGVKRVGRTLMLRTPDRKEVLARLKRSRGLAAMIEAGAVIGATPEPVSPGLRAFVTGFSNAVAKGGDSGACVRAALAAIGELAEDALPQRPAAPADGVPITSLRPMMFTASQQVFAGPELSGAPNEPVDDRLLRAIGNIERVSGVQEAQLRGTALMILGARDTALADQPSVEPPPMTPEEFDKLLSSIITRIRRLRSTAALRKAA
jgi:intracellular multiplication protein IcmO